jgi:hypothetical protein
MQVQLGKKWEYSQGHPASGNAQLARSGDTYTFTGTIQAGTGGSPVPFEVDVTCS